MTTIVPQPYNPAEQYNDTSAHTYGQHIDGMLAAQQTVNQNDLVSHNLTGLLSSENPYIQQARAQAAQYSASRGMLNSTMAAGAGEVAARQSALPIAQGDAQEYANVDSANQAATNTLAGQKLDYAGRVDSTRIGAAAQIHSAQIQAANALQLQQGNLALQYKTLAQQQGQFDSGEQNWQAQFGLTKDQFDFQKTTWQKTFDQSQHNWETGLDFQNYWQDRNLKAQASTNVLGFQSAIYQNPNMTPEQRSNALNSGNALTSAYIASLQGFQEWVPPWDTANSQRPTNPPPPR